MILLSYEERMMIKIEKILEEISELKNAFFMENLESIDKSMNKVFDTENRRNIWIHFDGNKTQEEISNLAGTSQMDISRFIKRYTTLGYLREDAGIIYKVFQYIPKSWL